MKLLLAILAFNLIVIIHEFGHFIVAKLQGIRVYEFSLFMGPKIFSFERGGTMFSIRLIPMLAYVAFDKEDSLYEDKSLGSHPVSARAAVIAAGPLFNIVSAAIALAIMFSLAGYQTMELSTVQKDTPAYEAGLKPGDRIVSFDHKRVYQPMEVDMFLYNVTKGSPVDMEVLRDGKIIPVKMTPRVIPENRPLIGFTAKIINGEPTNMIDNLEPGGPADKAGLKVNDIIVKLDNTEISNMQQILNFMYKNTGESIQVTVLRDGKRLGPIEIKPKRGRNPQMFSTEMYYTFKQGNPMEILGQSVTRTYSFTRIGLYSFAWLVQGKVPLNQMTGAVGAVDAINTVVQQSTSIKDVIVYLLFMSALISIGLGVTNLLPIPPADGSKLVLLAVEAIRRKPIPQEKEAFIMMAGFVFMMVLFVFTLYNDIARIIARVFGG
ncbi:MAG: RIP metalloprotease RseP [Clostridia bacterium]|nr:RIP metalloprotease RseP [Clostridia bacterium]